MARNASTPEQEERAAEALLPHLPVAEILTRYREGKGNEIASNKFASPESSAALAANTFGLFLTRPSDLPPLPGWTGNWHTATVVPEVEVRFPWSGGLHPWLDVVVETDEQFIGIESKRYEPFRARHDDGKAPFSDAYWRDKWGRRMLPYEWLRDGLAKRPLLFKYLDAVQLVKHAFGLRTQAHSRGKVPVLAYVYAEPESWPDGKPISGDEREQHAEEARCFARLVDGAEVRFMHFTYRALLAAFSASASRDVRHHADKVREWFDLV